MDAYWKGVIIATASMIFANIMKDVSRTTINDLRKTPQKLEVFYQKTRAEQMKVAEEKIKALKEKTQVIEAKIKQIQQPTKVVSAPVVDKYFAFKLQNAGVRQNVG